MPSTQEKLANVQTYKEPPEAFQVLSLDTLTNHILRQRDMSEWEKASRLSSTLERFLALKPKVFDHEKEPIVTPLSSDWVPESAPQPPPSLKSLKVRIPKNKKASPPKNLTHAPRKPAKLRGNFSGETESEDEPESAAVAPKELRRGTRNRKPTSFYVPGQTGRGCALKRRSNWICLK